MGLFDKFFGKKKTQKQPNPIQDSKELMDSEQFWSLISKSKINSLGDYENQQSMLEKELLKLSVKEILEFDNKFRSLRGEIYTWDFWAAAYIINGGCSDDCFSDFRGWLIGQGKSTFENALKDVESLSQLRHTNDGDWEGLSYVPTDAFEEKTGQEMPDGFEENFEITGQEWSEDGDELKNRFPQLWQKFNGL